MSIDMCARHEQKTHASRRTHRVGLLIFFGSILLIGHATILSFRDFTGWFRHDDFGVQGVVSFLFSFSRALSFFISRSGLAALLAL